MRSLKQTSVWDQLQANLWLVYQANPWYTEPILKWMDKAIISAKWRKVRIYQLEDLPIGGYTPLED